jgi:hypothetical protein
MAKGLKISTPYLSQMETGKRAIPSGYEEKIINYFSLQPDEANELRRAAALSRAEYQIAVEAGASDDDRALAHDLALSFARLSPEAKGRLRELLKEDKHASF